MTHIGLDKSKDNAKPHSICFLPLLRAEKGITWHIDARSVVWTLISNGKFGIQIARLEAIVVRDDLSIR